MTTIVAPKVYTKANGKESYEMMARHDANIVYAGDDIEECAKAVLKYREGLRKGWHFAGMHLNADGDLEIEVVKA